MAEFQKIRDDDLIQAWQRGHVQLIKRGDKVLLVGDYMTLVVGPRRCRLIGRPRDLQQAFLSLTDEAPTGPLADVAPLPRANTGRA
jgi:hypothetical protein